MAKLTHIIEKSVRTKDGSIQHQHIELSVDADKQGNFDSYDDVEATLYIDGKKVAEIGHLLSKAGVFTDMVCAVDWNKINQTEKQHL